MTNFEEYAEIKKRKMQRTQRLFALFSVCSFFGMTSFHLFNATVDVVKQPDRATATETAVASQIDKLKEQEKGLQIVLAREPNNQIVLEQLVQTRYDLNDLQGTKAALEKLIQLFPDRKDYQAKLTQVKTEQVKTELAKPQK